MFELTQDAVTWFFGRSVCCFSNKNRAKRVCELRLQGHTYKDIGEMLGISSTMARRYAMKVKQAYDRYMRANGIEGETTNCKAKADCFGFNKITGECKIMHETICETRECSFYKTKQQYYEDRKKVC